jgi:hypothetical protein
MAKSHADIHLMLTNNNLAERLIRTIAICRKITFGAQSKAESLYMERIMTTVATCN